MFAVAGRVIVRGAGFCLPGVVVEAFDVTKAGPSSKRLSDSDLSWVVAEPSLGSAITDDAGRFEWTVEGVSSLPVRLAVAVFGVSRANDGELLHLVERTRSLGAGRHQYVIAIPSDRLRRDSAGEPGAAAARVSSAREKAREADTLRAGAKRARSGRLDAARKAVSSTETSIFTALFDRDKAPAMSDGGVLSPFVLPLNTPARKHMRQVINTALRTKAQAFTARGLLDLSDKNREEMLDAAGAPKVAITQDQIRNALFGVGFADGTPERHRRDLLAIPCRMRTPPYERCEDSESGGEGTREPDDNAHGDSLSPEKQLSRIHELTTHLMEAASFDMAAAITSTSQRATAQSIGEDLKKLFIEGGPADDVALFDFERLFLAADLVVQPQPDPRLVANIAQSIRVVEDLGGDISASARPGRDLLDRLTDEVKALYASDPYKGLKPSKVPQQTQSNFTSYSFFQDLHDQLENALDDLAHKFDRFSYLRDYLADLSTQRQSSYPFSPFATDGDGPAVTFGLVLGYRQRWEPRGYQAGELVKSIPLAPKSTIKYSTKRKRVKSYSDKRTQASESTYSTESQDIARDMSKVVRETKLNTSLSVTHEAGGGVPGVGSGSTKVLWEVGAERDSSATKESFREETKKQAAQLKQNSSLEVTVAATDQYETEETSQISNPNDEIVVTYLFYELQRRFMVSEHLQRVTPVVLVAHPLPEPSSLGPVWLAQYDWILRRVLLDRSFQPALEYAVSGKLLADKGRAEELEASLNKQRDVVDTVKKDLAALRSDQLLPDPDSIWQIWLVHAYDEKYGYEWRDEEDKVRDVFGDYVADRLAQRRKTIQEREADLKRELGNFARATDAYVEGFTRYATEAIQVERLLTHIKNNISYYMQAIWQHELRDERYLRLRHVSIPDVTGTVTYSLSPSGLPPRAPTFEPPLKVTATSGLRISGDVELGDVADLAAPLGYIGNAMVFPLMRFNKLIEFLMVPFACALTGVNDPDDSGNMTLSDIEELTCCLKARLPKDIFETLKPKIDATWTARIDDPRPDAEEVVLPTGSTFIEALPGGHPVLEDFKLFHRAIDVQAAASELVEKRLEQLRMAARILTGQLDDPHIDKKVQVEGDVSLLPSQSGT